MAISLDCPQCKSRFQFGDDAAGKRARCQKCQHVFVIAAAPPPIGDVLNIDLEVIDDPPAQAVTAAPPAKAPAPKPPPAKAAPKAARKDTKPDDFDVRAYGGFTPAEKDRPARGRRPREEKDEDEAPAPSSPRRKPSADMAEPPWLKYLLLAAVGLDRKSVV